MKEHILKEKAFVYELPRTQPNMAGYEFNDENVEVVNKTKIVGIDYSKEKK